MVMDEMYIDFSAETSAIRGELASTTTILSFLIRALEQGDDMMVQVAKDLAKNTIDKNKGILDISMSTKV